MIHPPRRNGACMVDGLTGRIEDYPAGGYISHDSHLLYELEKPRPGWDKASSFATCRPGAVAPDRSERIICEAGRFISDNALFVQGADNPGREFVEYSSFCLICNLVVDAAGAHALAQNGVGAVGDIAYYSDTGEFYLDGFLVSFVVRFLYKSDFHLGLEEGVAVMEAGCGDGEIDWGHGDRLLVRVGWFSWVHI